MKYPEASKLRLNGIIQSEMAKRIGCVDWYDLPTVDKADCMAHAFDYCLDATEEIAAGYHAQVSGVLCDSTIGLAISIQR